MSCIAPATSPERRRVVPLARLESRSRPNRASSPEAGRAPARPGQPAPRRSGGRAGWVAGPGGRRGGAGQLSRGGSSSGLPLLHFLALLPG